MQTISDAPRDSFEDPEETAALERAQQERATQQSNTDPVETDDLEDRKKPGV